MDPNDPAILSFGYPTARTADPFGSPRSQTLFTMSKTPARISPGPSSARGPTTNLLMPLL
jgi:hypothetical protein